MPLYNEVANTPCFIWHPHYGCAGESRQALAQTIDIPATLLDSFGLPKPKDMQGVSLLPVLRNDTPVRDYALFGYHGCHINITDGRYVYMRAPVQQGVSGLYEYTLMPTRINRRFTPSEFQGMTLHPPFSFTKGCQLLKIPAESVMTRGADRFGHRLYDLHDDPLQQTQSRDTAAAERLCSSMKAMMAQSDAPSELYPRYGLEDVGGPLLGLIRIYCLSWPPLRQLSVTVSLHYCNIWKGVARQNLWRSSSPPANQSGRQKICGSSSRTRFQRSSIKACTIKWP